MSKTVAKFVYVNIDVARNLLLASTSLVGIGELVEIHAPDDDTPRQACGKTLRKTKDTNVYIIHTASEPVDSSSTYLMGERAILRVIARNRSGMLRRKFTPDEKLIVNLEKNERYKERRIVRAKTGSVRKKREKL
jgi:hypothetical protein